MQTAQQPGETPQEPPETDSTIQLPRKKVRQRESISPEPLETDSTIQLSRAALQQRRQSSPGPAEDDSTIEIARKGRRYLNGSRFEESEATQNLKQRRNDARKSLARDMLTPFDETAGEEQDDEIMERHANWQKVVERKTSHTLPVVAAVPSHRRPWFSLLLRKQSPRAFFWLSAIVLIALLLSGGFGIALSLGRTVQKNTPNLPPALQISPATIALGGIVTLRGTHFTPGGSIKLSRDKHIPLVDTGGMNSTRVDALGNFSDTIVVDPAWLSGPHTLYATDTHTQRQALYKIMVTGQNALQGPPRLLLSSNTLDLGSGDETTNGSKVFALSNAGGGVLTWQASVGKPWLQISPQSGSITSGDHASVIVAADRSELAPGSYQAGIAFTSNTGQVELTVTVKVTALQPGHEAIMQLSPATLTFGAAASGSAPGVQTIMVSNPGIQPLIWGANVSMQNGSGWLWANPRSGTISPGGQERVTVRVNSQGLPPGVYKGSLSFANRGARAIQGNAQNIYVSLTMTPACTLAFSPASLGFTGVHGGASPASKTLSIGTARGCATSQHWSLATATSAGGNWLKVNAAHGSTPAALRVSPSTAGLTPGVYHGTLTFMTSAGAQMVQVTLTVSPLPCTVSAPSALTLQGTAGQSSSLPRSVTLGANGDCQDTLNWTSSAGGSSWLSATPSGTLSTTAAASVNIQASLAGLSAGTYNGTVTLTVINSRTAQTVGIVQISVTLTAQQPCTLQAPSTGSQSFTASVGANPATPGSSITIGVTGVCSSSVTITPSLDSSGDGWLAVSGPVTIDSGGTATFTVTITSSSLAAGTYNSTITLTASGGVSDSASVVVSLVVQ